MVWVIACCLKMCLVCEREDPNGKVQSIIHIEMRNGQMLGGIQLAVPTNQGTVQERVDEQCGNHSVDETCRMLFKPWKNLTAAQEATTNPSYSCTKKGLGLSADSSDIYIKYIYCGVPGSLCLC